MAAVDSCLNTYKRNKNIFLLFLIKNNISFKKNL